MVKIIDLGMAAYIKMNGFEVQEVNKSGVFFKAEDKETENKIKALKIEYINSIFSTFDGLLMTLKRIPIMATDFSTEPNIQTINSLGQSSFIKMNKKWELKGRIGPNRFCFHVPIEEIEAFQQKQTEWANSPLRLFDANLMAIKQIRINR